MAHEVESMMYTGQTPWHGLGKMIPYAPTIEEAIKMAGLDWNVVQEPLFLADKRQAPAFANIRDSDKSILGVVGRGWKPVQNREAFNFFAPFLDNGLATLETAGSLRNGKRVFVLAKIKADPMEIVKGDAVERYILLAQGHDGVMGIYGGFTPIRVVCANTLRMAQGDEASKLIRIRHHAGAKDALSELQKVMDTANAEFLATAEQYRFLASKQCNADDLKKFVKMTIGVTEAEMAAGSTTGDRLLNKVVPLFEKGRGNDLPGVAGTYWGAYNAFNEYLGYEKGKEQDVRVDSLWFGQSANLNQKALEVATDMAMAA